MVSKDSIMEEVWASLLAERVAMPGWDSQSAWRAVVRCQFQWLLQTGGGGGGSLGFGCKQGGNKTVWLKTFALGSKCSTEWKLLAVCSSSCGVHWMANCVYTRELNFWEWDRGHFPTIQVRCFDWHPQARWNWNNLKSDQSWTHTQNLGAYAILILTWIGARHKLWQS